MSKTAMKEEVGIVEYANVPHASFGAVEFSDTNVDTDRHQRHTTRVSELHRDFRWNVMLAWDLARLQVTNVVCHKSVT